MKKYSKHACQDCGAERKLVEIIIDDEFYWNEKEKRYVSFIDDKCIFLEAPARYVNHSCDANTHVENFCDVASRDIKIGEEITGDYTSESVPSSSVKCNCGSDKCKGYLV